MMIKLFLLSLNLFFLSNWSQQSTAAPDCSLINTTNQYPHSYDWPREIFHLQAQMPAHLISRGPRFYILVTLSSSFQPHRISVGQALGFQTYTPYSIVFSYLTELSSYFASHRLEGTRQLSCDPVILSGVY